MKHPNQIKVGYTPLVFCHYAMVPCKIVEIRSKIDKRTGKVTE